MSDGSKVFREYEEPEAPPPDDPNEARLVALEQKLPDATAIITSLTQLGGAFTQLQQQVVFLSQQRAVAEQQLERHTRATALDLAIKAAPAAVAAADGERLTNLADAFVVWLKGGTN